MDGWRRRVSGGCEVRAIPTSYRVGHAGQRAAAAAAAGVVRDGSVWVTSVLSALRWFQNLLPSIVSSAMVLTGRGESRRWTDGAVRRPMRWRVSGSRARELEKSRPGASRFFGAVSSNLVLDSRSRMLCFCEVRCYAVAAVQSDRGVSKFGWRAQNPR